jgi:hypothetical protein
MCGSRLRVLVWNMRYLMNAFEILGFWSFLAIRIASDSQHQQLVSRPKWVADAWAPCGLPNDCAPRTRTGTHPLLLPRPRVFICSTYTLCPWQISSWEEFLSRESQSVASNIECCPFLRDSGPSPWRTPISTN